MTFPRVVIAGTQSGVGKTTLTIGLLAAFKQIGLTVQGFKAGPDYIDPSYHTAVTGRASRNLDTWLLKPDAVLWSFQNASKDADISVIEGVMGLYDGLGGTQDVGSTAHLAKLLDAPIILLIDGEKFSRSAAAIVLGYLSFDPKCRIAGVIVNNVSGRGHYDLIKRAIEKHISIPVLGFLCQDKRIKMPERYLGLIPAEEAISFLSFIDAIVDALTTHVDLNRILRIAKSAPPLVLTSQPFSERPIAPIAPIVKSTPRIAVARDVAFNFYYQDNLDLLERFGAEIIPFSPIKDEHLPKGVAGLYFGGGFPEMVAPQLEQNSSLRAEIKNQIEAGMPTYAECGGLMYLSESIKDHQGKSWQMVGAMPGNILMTDRLQNFGYTIVKATRDTLLARKGERIKGHEFHYSLSDTIPVLGMEAYHIPSRKNRPERYEGFAKDNFLASYVHVHFLSKPQWAKRLVEKAEELK